MRVAVLVLGVLALLEDLDVAFDVLLGATIGALVPLVATAMIWMI